MKKMLFIVSMFFVGMAYFCNAGQGFDFPRLPKDMQYEIMLNYIDDAIAGTESLSTAINKIKNLIVVNKDLNSVINESVFCLKLIKKLAQKFNFSDQEVAQWVGIKCTQERFKLQNEFLDFLRKPSSNKIVTNATFDKFLRRGVDLEWKNRGEYTPLHVAVLWYDLDAVKLLLSKGANVNYVTKYGTSALLRAATYYSLQGHGEVPIETVKEIIRTLLAAGADPNANGLNTRSDLDKIPKEVRGLIEDAQKNWKK